MNKKVIGTRKHRLNKQIIKKIPLGPAINGGDEWGQWVVVDRSGVAIIENR